ncbi:extracellular solute-binding protein [Fluviibacterium sp. DFM31]|uniref:Extracellular solute-binding protein n=1 Tax=Meridianimarinicoccus marinus TaxID=3231483 RepID=A0ABV3L8Q4_9RHOB
MNAKFTGLTWDHPRGYEALAEAARKVNAEHPGAPLLHWNKQPLEGFESAPIAQLASENDLVVMDHPHIGEAVAEDCLVPIEDLFPETTIAAWGRQSIGPSMRSYLWQGKHWALPLDVAMQTMMRRADMVATPPDSWEAVLDMAHKVPVAQSLAGPHAILTLMSICGGAGVAPRGDEIWPEAPALRGLEIMHRLYRLRPPGSETLNPIQMSEVMARGDEIALVPLIFNYITYARAGDGRYPLAFSDSLRTASGLGGMIGGTGIAFTKRCQPDPELLAHVRWLMDPPTQTRFLPAHGGQPSARVAWQDDAVNRDWGKFYRDTAATAEHALLRPRFDGYVDFQTRGGARVRQALETGEAEHQTLAALRSLWQEIRSRSRGDLDDTRPQANG